MCLKATSRSAAPGPGAHRPQAQCQGNSQAGDSWGDLRVRAQSEDPLLGLDRAQELMTSRGCRLGVSTQPSQCRAGRWVGPGGPIQRQASVPGHPEDSPARPAPGSASPTHANTQPDQLLVVISPSSTTGRYLGFVTIYRKT